MEEAQIEMDFNEMVQDVCDYTLSRISFYSGQYAEDEFPIHPAFVLLSVILNVSLSYLRETVPDGSRELRKEAVSEFASVYVDKVLEGWGLLEKQKEGLH